MRFKRLSFVGELRPDEDFDTPRCNRKAPFDGERVDATLCHITAGVGIPFSPAILRDHLQPDAPPDHLLDMVVADDSWS